MIGKLYRKLYVTARQCVLPVLKYLNTCSLIHDCDNTYGKGNYIILNPPQGLGDILACCCAIEYLNNEGKKAFVLVNKKYFADIQAFFPEEYVKLLYIPKWFSDKSYKNYFPLSRKMYFPELPYISMKHNLCVAMGISPDVSFHNLYKKQERKYDDFPSIKDNKTVVLSPFATSCKDELNVAFWERLTKSIMEKGYEVVFNAPSDSYYAKYYKSCLLNLEDTVELVTRCGFFIGWRSGLCDIIGMYANAKIIVVYPSNPNYSESLFIPDGLSYSEAYMKSCSLKTLWGKEAVEIINNPDLFNQIDKEFDYADKRY